MGLRTRRSTMVQYLCLVCLMAVSLAAAEAQQSASVPSPRAPATPTPPKTESTPTACNNPWDGENWTSNSFKLYRRVCREEQLCFNRTRNNTVPVCRSENIQGFSYQICETKIEVVREQYCIQRTVCERQANIAGVGRSTLRAYEMGIISHANGSDKSDQYENDTDQIWNIEATKPSQNIYLYIDTLDIEESADCTKDYLLIQDSPCSSTRRLCGSASDISYRSTTGQLQIKFSSDSDTSGRGYWGFYWLADRENLRPGRST